MQKQLVIIGVIIVGIAAIWTYRASTGQSEEAISIAPTPAAEQSVSTVSSDTGTPVPDSVDDAPNSPFAIVDEATSATDVASDESSEPAPAADSNRTLQVEDNSAQVSTDSSADTESSPGIVVPSSYPASEAARYFVPADQRRPGNLGGPPPLPFADSDTSGAMLPDGGAIPPPPPPPAQ